MRTLPLRGGTQVPVVAAEWCNAFGIVTRGQVQLELRNGEPGPAMVRIVIPRTRPSHASQHTPRQRPNDGERHEQHE